ncbi:MAG: hypothetical protein EOO78_30605 [Oxalobacteraceae bacterium]|nr:MAG: hypothetical protein EOO78_30605 [Oxalobacteraceae bacterium]
MRRHMLHCAQTAFCTLLIFATGWTSMGQPAANSPLAAAAHRPLVIAHRGGSLEAPENTVEAVAHGVRCGADWQEVDVTLSRDGRVVVIHDAELTRTTNGYGLVEHTDIAELVRLQAGEPLFDLETLAEIRALGVEPPLFRGRFAQARVPSLRQVLAVPQARLMIEIKSSDRPLQLARAVIDTVDEAAMAQRVAVGSFNAATLHAVHTLAPSLPLIGIVDDAATLQAMLQLPVAALSVDKRFLAQAQAAAPEGLPIWIWTAYTAEEALALAAAGASGLTTDVPAAVVERLRSAPR